MSTVTVTLSSKARETAFAVCQNRRYSPDMLLVAASMLQKLKGDAQPMTRKMPSQTGEIVDVTIYKGFPDNVEVELTLEEKDVIVNALKTIPDWHPDEAQVVLELQEKLQAKLI